MQFSTLNLKAKYDSDEDDILSDFYLPLFKRAVTYDRAVGYFSSYVFEALGEGLEAFILSKGHIRLIIGDPLLDEEYEAVMQGNLLHAQSRQLELSKLLLNTQSKHLKILTYLIASQQLKIKFAFTSRGMFHKKIGIFKSKNESVAFNGSANETISGLSKYNSEEISVFFSWKNSFSDYGQAIIDDFEKLWIDAKKRTRVVELDSEFYEALKNSVDKEQLYSEIFDLPKSETKKTIQDENPKANFFFQYNTPISSQELIIAKADQKRPNLPLYIKGNEFNLFSHQKEAIRNWERANYSGLMKLATGSGKTITSICAMIELYDKRMREQMSTVVVIAVPYIELANQWITELMPFNISAVACFESIDKWCANLDRKILRFNAKELSFLCMVVVNKTLSSVNFQNQMNRLDLDKMLFIGDECHRLGSDNLFANLPKCQFRLGLSATPFRSEEELDVNPFPDVAKQNLLSYFGGIISDYSLSDAINDGILTPYRYDLVPVYLTQDEQETYEELSAKIQKLMLKAKNSFLTQDEKQYLTNLCGIRSRLLATCKGKLPAFLYYIESHPKLSLTHSLVYVGEGNALDEDEKYINKVTTALFELNIKVAKFTSSETSIQRKRIMNSFKKKEIDALVAMKVLDEGIDVPVCQTAFILASTRNPRQYVQRRGRVLRKFSGKTSALIVDFIILPFDNLNNSFSNNLRKAERERIEDFRTTAINFQEVEEKMMSLGIK